MMAELASLQEPDFGRIDEFDLAPERGIEQGLTLSATAYLRALRRRPLVMRRVRAALADVDVLITPGVGAEPGIPRYADSRGERRAASAATRVAAQHHDLRLHRAAGADAAFGVGRSGLPVGI